MAMLNDLPEWEEFASAGRPEYHGSYTITLVQLLDDEGFAEYFAERWCTFDAYDEEQRARLLVKFRGRFDYREIGIIPVRRWCDRLFAKLDEVMPKYKPIYEAIAGGATPLNASDEWHRRRDVYSSFPQTRFNGGNEDYASSGTDVEYETLRDLGLMDVGERIGAYNDVDVLVLNELETLFMVLKSMTLPNL